MRTTDTVGHARQRGLRWFIGVNLTIAVTAAITLAAFLGYALPVLAQATPHAGALSDQTLMWGFIAAGASTAIGTLAAAYAVSHVGAAALAAMGERPELAGRALIFVGLAEGLAIYGLIVSIMILGRLT